jgi:predicted RecA/RadA family phage recombinase
MKNFIQYGDTIDINVATATVAGQLLTIGDVVGVVVNTTAANIDNAMCIDGVFEVPKAVGAITFGVKVYHDNVAGNITTTAGSLKLAGYAVSAQASGDATVKVKLIF